MNERIAQLAQQAAEDVIGIAPNRMMVTESETNKIEIPDTFIEMFAKLVARDCMQQCDPESGLKYSPNALSSRLDCKEKINKHFGVNE